MSKRKIYNPLRIVRIVAASIVLVIFTLLFVDWGDGTPALRGVGAAAGWLAEMQFLPALLSLSIGAVCFVVASVLLFGRLYCSVLCPLGTAQDCVNRAAIAVDKGAARRFSYRPTSAWLRYGVLAFTLLSAVAGFGVGVALLEPYSIFGRTVHSLLRPVVQGLNNTLALFFGDSFGSEPLSVGWLSFAVALVMALVVVIFAWRGGRRYCNAICPVGTILGEMSRAAAFRVKIDEHKCVDCGLCGKMCKAECIDMANHSIDPTRCVVCFDCIDNCSQEAISFGFSPLAIAKRAGEAKSQSVTTDAKGGVEAESGGGVSRKKFLATLATVATIPAVEAQRRAERARGAAAGGHGEHGDHGDHSHSGEGGCCTDAIAPAGSRSLKNLHAKCTACHLCISKCPTHVLQPAVMEYGLQGVLQPTLRFDKGYCLYDCHICGEVCPTGAIELLDIEDKKMTAIGHAVFNKDLCVVNTEDRECGNCAEHCSAEAIKMVRSPFDGKLYPEVEKALCIGCGECEFLCPASPVKAITIRGYKEHR